MKIRKKMPIDFLRQDAEYLHHQGQNDTEMPLPEALLIAEAAECDDGLIHPIVDGQVMEMYAYDEKNYVWILTSLVITKSPFIGDYGGISRF